MWVLADAEPGRALGPALVIARREAPDVPLHVVVEEGAGLLARRASQFEPAPTVWQVDGAALRRAEPDPVPAATVVDPRLAAYADLLAAAGTDPVVEHGRLIGEVRGLEVARVEIVDGEPRLDVGVGRFDREANALLHADQPTEETLRRVVSLVLEHRRDAADDHPLNRLARSRWLRWRVLQAPSLVGAAHLAPMAPVIEPPDLRTPWPAPATGVDTAGEPIVVVCSVGVDLDLVPAAADARLADGRQARLVLAVPSRDRHTVTEALAGMLAAPAELVAVDTLDA